MAQNITMTAPAAKPAPRFVRAANQTLRRMFRDLFDPYRPELHYMRGPGPKWRAKHGSSAGANQRAA